MLHNGNHHGNGDKHRNQNAHYQQLLLFGHIFHQVALNEIQRQGGAGGQHQTGQGGHGCGKHQHHHNTDEHRRQLRQHGGDDGIIVAGGLHGLGGGENQPTKAAQEIAATRHDQGEDGGNDHALGDGLFIFDGVELLHHLRKTPGSKAGQQHHACQTAGIRTKEGGEGAGGIGNRRVGDFAQLLNGFGNAAVISSHRNNHGDDAENHNDALDKVVDGSGHITAHDDINGRQHRHGDDANRVINVKGHAKQSAQAVIQGCGVGNQENEDDRRGGQLQFFAVEALMEELGHGGAV